MAILVTALTVIAAGFGRQMFALRLLEGSLASHHLAEDLFVRETLQREHSLDVPMDSVEGYAPFAHWQAVQLSRTPLPDLELDLLTAEVQWALRGRSRSFQVTAGFSKKKEETPPK